MSILKRILAWIVYLGTIFVIMTGSIIAIESSSHASELSIPEMTLVAEAKNQGYEGMLAVAEVIRTRMEERGLTADQVCLEKWQFSCWNIPQKGFKLVYDLSGYTSEYQMEAIHELARRAWFDSDRSYIVRRANLYHHKSIKPSWIDSKRVEYIGQIKDHMFYKEYRN